MKKTTLSFILLFLLLSQMALGKELLKTLEEQYPLNKGFISYIFDEEKGKLYLKVDNLNSDFIYQTSLPQGLGSNDIGLDRGQLGRTHLVKFEKAGNKLLLIAQNTRYRASSNNAEEKASIEGAFASSVLWGFPIVETNEKWLLVDASKFILQDIHGVARKLKARKQGNFKREPSRSAIYVPRTKAFPDNSEFEARVTFTSDKPGKFVQQASVYPNSISLRMHHSFIRLPDDDYKVRKFHSKSGFWSYSFEDYAQPINQSITQRLIPRHRLEKKNSKLAVSEAIEPIIYYLDPGAPEPVKTALIDGAMWWDQAFSAIGYKDAFQVKILPKGSDPMDIRFNVIQWVHRATRGWSYGYTVTDPRTGEILKGHVTLGSLRVRQDYLLAQGMLSRFDESEADSELMALALARIRQLSAHEIGHTLGIAHNFAASSYGRASVMDYPHPVFEIDPNSANKVIADNAYAENIGKWDKRVIAYGYQDDGSDKALEAILAKNKSDGMIFISDPDARKVSDAHAIASLWDNGANAVEELKRMYKVRALALNNFGLKSLHANRPLSDLQEILIPVYYSHRYQIEAAAKWIGGVQYEYESKDEIGNSNLVRAVSGEEQDQAIETILMSLNNDFLMISDQTNRLIYPKAYGYQSTRESLIGKTGVIFDRIQLAANSIQHTFSLLLNPTKLERIIQQNAEDSRISSIDRIAQSIHENLWVNTSQDTAGLIKQQAIDIYYSNLLNLIRDETISMAVKSRILSVISSEKRGIRKKLKSRKTNKKLKSFLNYQMARLAKANIQSLKKEQLIKLPILPPGSPI